MELDAVESEGTKFEDEERDVLDRALESVDAEALDSVSSDEESFAVVSSESDEAALSLQDSESGDSLDTRGGLGERSAALQMRSISRRMLDGISLRRLTRRPRIWFASSTWLWLDACELGV